MKISLTPWVLVTHKHNQIAQLESNQLHQLSMTHQQRKESRTKEKIGLVMRTRFS
jgi:hypothetical protein